jgi:hypothetical protein
MKKVEMILAVAAIGWLIMGTSAVAQHEHHNGAVPAPAVTETTMTGGMAMRQQMMSQHDELVKLTERVLNSFASLKSEKDPATLQRKLTEHGTLLKELQSKLQAFPPMNMAEKMQNTMGNMQDQKMQGQMSGGCPMMGMGEEEKER